MSYNLQLLFLIFEVAYPTYHLFGFGYDFDPFVVGNLLDIVAIFLGFTSVVGHALEGDEKDTHRLEVVVDHSSLVALELVFENNNDKRHYVCFFFQLENQKLRTPLNHPPQLQHASSLASNFSIFCLLLLLMLK